MNGHMGRPRDVRVSKIKTNILIRTATNAREVFVQWKRAAASGTFNNDEPTKYRLVFICLGRRNMLFCARLVRGCSDLSGFFVLGRSPAKEIEIKQPRSDPTSVHFRGGLRGLLRDDRVENLIRHVFNGGKAICLMGRARSVVHLEHQQLIGPHQLWLGYSKVGQK